MVMDVRVVGVGMVPFAKPGASENYAEMGSKAVNAALTDAGLPYSAVQQAYAGYVYGDSTCGQTVLYRAGMTGIPIVNVNNNCSTGSTALFLARQAVASGAVDCALAVGFEEMRPGALASNFPDRAVPMQRHVDLMADLQERDPKAPRAAQFFGGAGAEYAKKHGTRDATFAKIAEKARKHAANNPYAIFRAPLSVDEILASPTQYGPMTRFQCCPPTCGAAAAIVCSPAFAARHGLDGSIAIKAQAMTTDRADAFEQRSMVKLVGYDMAKNAAAAVYEAAGVGPEDVQVAELHDCFTANELLMYEALGLTPEGTAEQFIVDAGNTYGGKIVTNPSGGLLSKGHPLGATGLAQCTELVWQLRGTAERRQVPDVTHALQHNVGLGGACVVTLYGRA
jgi:acetyl-CoA acetyltransferase